MKDTSKILWESYDKYFLDLGQKKVPTPYRLNSPKQNDRRKYGKAAPEELTEDVKYIASKQKFDLNQASEDEIKSFMKENQLGIDCSGYVYHCLDYLLKNLGKDGMKSAGFPDASKTNVKKLSEMSQPIQSLDQIQPGDIITFRSGPNGHGHILLVMEIQNDKIIYSHSSGFGKIRGVKQNSITITNPQKGLKEQFWDEEISNGDKRVDHFHPELGDGVRRIKALI